jgi:hypothetical protein
MQLLSHAYNIDRLMIGSHSALPGSCTLKVVKNTCNANLSFMYYGAANQNEQQHNPVEIFSEGLLAIACYKF